MLTNNGHYNSHNYSASHLTQEIIAQYVFYIEFIESQHKQLTTIILILKQLHQSKIIFMLSKRH